MKTSYFRNHENKRSIMLKRSFLSLLTVTLFLSVINYHADAQVTIADYQRADTITKLNDLVYNQVSSVNWIDSTHFFWYR